MPVDTDFVSFQKEPEVVALLSSSCPLPCGGHRHTYASWFAHQKMKKTERKPRAEATKTCQRFPTLCVPEPFTETKDDGMGRMLNRWLRHLGLFLLSLPAFHAPASLQENVPRMEEFGEIV